MKIPKYASSSHRVKLQYFADKCAKIAEEAKNTDTKKAMFYEWTTQAIAYYIGTGRSTTDWECALLKATPEKLLKAVGEKSGSTTEGIAAITNYLGRYCGLKY